MNSFSVTIIGLVVYGIAWIANRIGLPAPDAEHIKDAIATIIQVVGLFVAYYGRYRHGDITWYGAKKVSNITIDSLPPEIHV